MAQTLAGSFVFFDNSGYFSIKFLLIGGNRENGKNRALSTLTPVLRSTTPDAEGFAQVALCQFSGAANNSGACNLLLFADNPTIGRFAHREEKAWRPKRLTTPP